MNQQKIDDDVIFWGLSLNTSHLDSNLRPILFLYSESCKSIHFFATANSLSKRNHHRFNIRHMSGVFSGLLQAKPGEFAEAEKARGEILLKCCQGYQD